MESTGSVPLFKLSHSGCIMWLTSL